MEDNAVSIYWIWTAGVVLAFLIIGMARKRKATGSLEEFCYGDIYADDFLPCVGIDISLGYFIPLVLVCIFEIGAMGLYPHETCLVLDKATPSYSTNNWIWTSIVAFLSPLPVGTQIAALISLFDKSYPESDIIKYILIALNGFGIGCVTYAFADVYSIWYIWIPIISGIIYSTLLWPLTPKEKEAYDDNMERNELVYTTPSSTPSIPSRSSSSSSRSSSSRSSYPSSSSSHDDSSELRKEMYRRQAEEYLYQARQYEDEASRLESEADSYILSYPLCRRQ